VAVFSIEILIENRIFAAIGGILVLVANFFLQELELEKY